MTFAWNVEALEVAFNQEKVQVGPSMWLWNLCKPSFETLVGSAGPAINLNSVTTAGRAAQHTLSPVGRLLRGEIIIATDGDNITSCSNNTTATRESDRANNVGPRAKWKETTGSDQYKCLSTFQYESELWSLLACCYPPPNGHPPLHPSPLEFINFDIKTIGSRFCDLPSETTCFPVDPSLFTNRHCIGEEESFGILKNVQCQIWATLLPSRAPHCDVMLSSSPARRAALGCVLACR